MGRSLLVILLALLAGGGAAVAVAELRGAAPAQTIVTPTTITAAPTGREIAADLKTMLADEKQLHLEQRVQRLYGCLPELVDYVNAYASRREPLAQLTGACIGLFYPEGVPQN